MDLDILSKLGEFVGGFFVVVSLIYLAHQVRQNTKSLRSENYARMLDRMSSLQSQLAADAEFNRVIVIGSADPGRLTRSERIRFSWGLYQLFGAAEFVFHQFREKALLPAVWGRWEASLRWWLSHPGMREWWIAKPAPFTSDFEAFVREMMHKDPMDPVTLERWERFVAGNNGAAQSAAPQASAATAA
jgi:hypothetical protein